MTKLLFIGDSITASWSDSEALLFSSRGWQSTAKAGETSGAIAGRLPADLEVYRPDRVHILCGINDIAENDGPYSPDRTKRNIGNMIEICSSSLTPCIIATLLPAEVIPWRPDLEVQSRIADLVAWLLRICRTLPSGTLIDYHGAFRELGDRAARRLTSDGVHPNAAGLRFMTHVLLAKL